MSNLYKTAFRGYLIDHHSPDPPTVTLENLDPAEYEQFFMEANITNLMLYCKDHWGVCYYDTKIGRMHPGLKDDWISILRPILKKNNIEFNAYYCLEYDNWAPVAHPEWAVVRADGTPLKCSSPIAHWKMPCYETGYREYALNQIKEIIEGYSPDSLFLDIFGKSLCYCPACREKFQKEYGYPLPEDEKAINEKYSVITEFLDNSAKSMLADIKEAVASIDKSVKVTINFSALYNKEIRDMLDYQFTEPFAGNWLSAAYARDTAVGQYPQLGPGNVSQVYNYKPESIYMLAASQIAAQGCRVFMYSGSQHPDGTLEHEEARHIGTAYREIEKFEKYLTNRSVISDIAIIQSDISAAINNDNAFIANAIGRAHQGSVHRDSITGAMKLCDNANLTWKILPEAYADKETLAGFKMVILPDVFYISDSLKIALEEYVNGGGKLFLSGETGLFEKDGKKRKDFALSGLIGASYVSKIDKYKKAAWGGYLSPSKHFLLRSICDTYAPVSSIYYEIAPTSSEALNYLVYPAAELTENTWVNWWNPPPMTHNPSQNPGIILNDFGKGKVIYAAFDFLRMAGKDFYYTNGLFEDIAYYFLEKPSLYLKTQNKHALSIVSYDRPENSEIIVHEISNIAAECSGDAPVIKAGELIVSKDYKQLTKAEIVYPEHYCLDIKAQDENQVIVLPDISIHQIIRLQYSE